MRTPSYWQVTEKLYTRAAARWLRYRDQLAPVLPVLEPWAARFGYEPRGESAGRGAAGDAAEPPG